MDDAITWLNDNAGAVQGIATVVLVLITAVSVVFTLMMSNAARKQADANIEMVDEMRAQRAFEGRPILDLRRKVPENDHLAFLEYDHQDHVWCTVKNIGRGAAINITSTLVYELDGWPGVQSLDSLGPGDETASVPLAVSEGRVTLQYQDTSSNTYRSHRLVKYAYNNPPDLDELSVESVP